MTAYGSDADFIAYLASQGLVLPSGAPDALVLRTIGSSYVDSAYEPGLNCSERTDPWNQELAWPRRGAKLGRRTVPPNLVPRPWVTASYRAAWLQVSSPGWAQGGRDPSRLVKREKVDGAAEREFFEIGKGGVQSQAAPGFNVDPIIEGMVGPWLCVEEEEPSGFFFASIGGGSCPRRGLGDNGGPELPPVPDPIDPVDPVDPPAGTTPVAEFGERRIRVLDFGDELITPDADFGEEQITITST